MKKKSNISYSFDKDTIWSYGVGKIKVFVPHQFIIEFETYCKKNNIPIVKSSTYAYQKKNIEKQDIKDKILRAGVDFIIDSDFKPEIIKYLRTKYKEYNKEIK